jgi:hypothetical protein
MNDGEDDAEFAAQLNQQAKKRNRINPARNRDPNPASCAQKLFPPDMA